MNITLDAIKDSIHPAVANALSEDIQTGDITALLIPEDKQDTAQIITREDCTLCGTAWVEETFKQLDSNIVIKWHVKEGDRLSANTTIATLSGNTRTLLTGERTALNFLQTLSAVATKASQYADLLPHSEIKILDTRKTIPGLRLAQKYAVAVGGCHNHRIGLYDAFLIKENHIAGCGSISNAVKQARSIAPEKKVEVEVENIAELEEALAAKADIVMLDNFSTEDLEKALKLNKGDTKYEASGNLTAENIVALQKYQIDYMSFGALTKHIQAVDLSMRILSPN